MRRKLSVFLCENLCHCDCNETNNSEIWCQNKDLHFLKERKVKLSESDHFWSIEKSEKVRYMWDEKMISEESLEWNTLCRLPSPAQKFGAWPMTIKCYRCPTWIVFCITVQYPALAKTSNQNRAQRFLLSFFKFLRSEGARFFDLVSTTHIGFRFFDSVRTLTPRKNRRISVWVHIKP